MSGQANSVRVTSVIFTGFLPFGVTASTGCDVRQSKRPWRAGVEDASCDDRTAAACSNVCRVSPRLRGGDPGGGGRPEPPTARDIEEGPGSPGARRAHGGLGGRPEPPNYSRGERDEHPGRQGGHHHG